MKFILESRQANLYHTTNLHNLISILESDTLKIGKPYFKDKDNNKGKISLTRSYSFAKAYKGDVILVLDQLKLSYSYKIKPVSDYANQLDQYSARFKAYSKAEEDIEKDITNLHKYIIKIQISAHAPMTDEYFNIIEEYSDKYNIPIEVI